MQLSEHVHGLRIPFTVFAGPIALERFVFAYVIVGERVGLVDTGVAGSAPRILAAVAEAGRRQSEVSDILLTHAHVDHIGSAKALVEATGARVHAHPDERRWIEDVACQAKERPVPGFRQLCDAGVTVDGLLADEQVLALAPELHVRALATPGHSPGGVSFLVEEDGVLLCGDAVPVKGDMPVYDDPVQSLRSLARLRELRGVRTLASAWDRPRSDADVAVALADGARVIEEVDAAVRRAQRDPREDALGFCKEVVADLAMPPPFANPMCLRTFVGHFEAQHEPRRTGPP